MQLLEAGGELLRSGDDAKNDEAGYGVRMRSAVLVLLVLS